MEASPVLDPRVAVPGIPPPIVVPDSDAERVADAEGMSLARRLRQPRTILSIAVPILVIGIFVWLNGAQLSKVPGLVLGANPALVLAAFIVFYAGFPLRGLRWATLLQGTGLRIGTKDSMEIIFLSWLVNCVVPAKLGDVYRAYLLKINSDASLSRTFGTVFIERVLDLFAIAVLGLAAGYWSFRTGLPPAIQLVFGIGVIVVVALGVGLFTMRNFGRQIIVALPLPHQVLELYDRFEEGVFGALVARHLPSLGVMTGFIWMTEALRERRPRHRRQPSEGMPFGSPAKPSHRRYAAVMACWSACKSTAGTGGVLSSGVAAPQAPQRTAGDPTIPFSSPSWGARGQPVPTGDTGVLPPSASSWHRGTERAAFDRTWDAPRSAQAA
jgi:hypothetical protein